MRQIFFLVFLVLSSCRLQETGTIEQPIQLDDGIQTARLEEVDMDEVLINAMQDSVTNGSYPNIHSVLILRNNKLVYEKYWPGYDQNRRTNFFGETVHHRDSLHDIRSITKSVISAGVMIALDQGKFKNLDQRLFDFFPEYANYAEGEKQEITIRNLLTMTSGLHWQESYNDSLKKHDVAYAMAYILRQPLDSAPGSSFSYNSASTQLLAQIVERATGMAIESFILENLFEPLGINNFDWTTEKNGLTSAWAGLRMRSRDMMKFGMLYLNQGKWNGKQIISSHLVEESMRTNRYTEETYGYGYQFWTLADSVQNRLVITTEASGNGGQKIEINHSENLVLVITAGNYDEIYLGKTPYDLYLDFVIPAVIK